MKITHTNFGFEQSSLELAKAEGIISKEENDTLNYLLSLPQNRVENNGAIALMVAESIHAFERTCKNQNF